MPLSGSLLMAAIVWLTKAPVAAAIGWPPAALAASVAIGAAAYVLFLAVFGRRALKPYIDTALSALRRGRAATTSTGEA